MEYKKCLFMYRHKDYVVDGMRSALGLAVDDTIHLLNRYRHERARGATLATAIETAVAQTGRAVLFTSILLAAGLLVVATSGLMNCMVS